MSATMDELGVFAPDQGAMNVSARLAGLLGGAALLLGLVRPVSELVDPAMEARWAARVGALLGTVAIALAFLALYQISARGQRGRWVAFGGLSAVFAGAVISFFYGAIKDGNLRPGEFGRAYLDGPILNSIKGDLLRGAYNTVKLALVSEVFALLVGLVVATLVLSKRKILHYPGVIYVDGVRGLPLIVLTFLIYFGLVPLGVSLAPFVAAVAILTINASAYNAEIFRAGVQSLSRGQLDAARSLGMAYAPAMIFVVLPQAIRAVIPPLMSEFIALIKDTAIVLLGIGVTVSTRDLFGAAQNASSSTFSPTPFIGAAIGYLIITVPLTRLVGRLERRLRTGLA